MPNVELALVPFVLCAVAAAQRPLAHGPHGEAGPLFAITEARPAAEAAPRFEPVLTARRDASPAAADDLAADPRTALAPRKLLFGSGYTKLKAGYFFGDGDMSDLDDGFAAEVVFGRELLSFLALEISAGYVRAEDSTFDTEIWAIPLFVQARAGLPILVFEPYVGVGVGGMYVDASGMFGSASDFVGAATGFAGVEFGVGELAVGLEAKYMVSDEVDSSFDFEGWAVTVGISLPF